MPGMSRPGIGTRQRGELHREQRRVANEGRYHPEADPISRVAASASAGAGDATAEEEVLGHPDLVEAGILRPRRRPARAARARGRCRPRAPIGRERRSEGIRSGARAVERVEHRLERDRDSRDVAARSVGDRVGDGGGDRHDRRLGDTLRAEWALRVGVLEEDDLDLRDVGRDRQAIRLERPLAVAAIGPDREAFVERVADALRDATLHLADDPDRVDGATHLLRHDVAHDRDDPGHRVDVDLGEMDVVGRGRERREQQAGRRRRGRRPGSGSSTCWSR